jgi:uncharacterized cofD-like protein
MNVTIDHVRHRPTGSTQTVRLPARCSARWQADAVSRVVALGGGHGTAVTLRAVRRYATSVTAVVSVADDGGSTGRLREQLDIVALGDLRKCLVALAAESSVLARAFEHRFEAGDLSGHAVGNVVLAGMIEAAGGLLAGIEETSQLLGTAGRVLPATAEKVVLQAIGEAGEVNGQVAVSRAGRIRSVSLAPEDVAPPAEAVDAILMADQVVIGPGSLYTSVLAAAAVRGIATALAATSAQRVYVSNLRPQVPETEGYSVGDHVDALDRHGVQVDVALVDSFSSMPIGRPGVQVVERLLARRDGLVHDRVKLAEALEDLLASGARPPRGRRERAWPGMARHPAVTRREP